MQLEKMLEMNRLLSFYGDLLSPRQREFMKDYYEEDFTLQEIAENNEISRQAVSDSIRKAEQSLQDFEAKLNNVADFKVRRCLLHTLTEYVKKTYPNDLKLQQLVENVIQNKSITGEE
ncbi:YlxM family DNA-binding protein [Allofustis seminis]|uniref:YlxM family DNA-binding protein n=1 Tax=Allofustis seminis TaxID=166939 RepID=UPI00036C68CC|nr:YlxM family DNA-binding protein [Allofustis seminis]